MNLVAYVIEILLEKGCSEDIVETYEEEVGQGGGTVIEESNLYFRTLLEEEGLGDSEAHYFLVGDITDPIEWSNYFINDVADTIAGI